MSNESTAGWNPYTQHPEQSPSTVFPEHGMQVFSQVIFASGLSILAYCFAHRTGSEEWTWIGFRAIPWTRLCVILVFLDSWLFLFISSFLIYGTGLSYSGLTCSLAIFTCITCYFISKVLIYSFLVEKVYIVWSSYNETPKSRLATPIWRFGMAILTPFIGIGALSFWGHYAALRDDRACVIGLNRITSISVLVYDLFVTMVLTGLFVWPLWTLRVSSRFRQVATRSLVASIAALATSGVNIAILTAMHGHQLGWICLSSCGSDVTINAIVLYWVTRGFRRTKESRTSGRPSHSGGARSHSTSGKEYQLSPLGATHMPLGRDVEVSQAMSAGNITTHFSAPPPIKSKPVKTEVVRKANTRTPAGSASPSFVAHFVDKMHNIASTKENEEHSTGVHVTVTTEVQLDTPSTEKYATSISTTNTTGEGEDKHNLDNPPRNRGVI